jgi:hypothetical protein
MSKEGRGFVIGKIGKWQKWQMVICNLRTEQGAHENGWSARLSIFA